MIVLDSSVWIEGWKDASSVEVVDAQIHRLGGDPEQLLVPVTVVYETTRWLIRNLDHESDVAEHAASLDRHESIPIDAVLARGAALISVTTGLAAADATILAAARSRHAHLLTNDEDFAGIPNVTVVER